jgi:putative YhdH/YhfP family quinone oxidoreductase
MPGFSCYLVEKDAEGSISAGFSRRNIDELPPGEVLVRVSYSSLNYKDGLAARGNPGVARRLPHIPGVDAAGLVENSSSPDFSPGQPVLVTGHDFGSGRWGGWAEYIRVPADWVIPLPPTLGLEEAMSLGTAGFTAALCVRRLIENGIGPETGEVVVTGSTGGVGSIAVMILASLAYRVAAVTGKADRTEWLRGLGAATVLKREEVDIAGGNPLLKGRWAGAVDTVGGNTLATLLRTTMTGGCVTACGLVGGTEFATSVHPFILRGVSLCGVDSAWIPRARRLETWELLAAKWKPAALSDVSITMGWKAIPELVESILAGGIVGRRVIRIAG